MAETQFGCCLFLCMHSEEKKIFLLFIYINDKSTMKCPQHIRELLYQVYYTRYQILFCLWQIGPVIEHCEVPNYYDRNFRITLVWVNQTDSKFIKPASTRFSKYKLQVLYVGSFGLNMEVSICPLLNNMSPLQWKSFFKEKAGKGCISSYIWFFFFSPQLKTSAWD